MKPIIFSAPMVRAILDGRKTQTRRVVKPLPLGRQPPHNLRNTYFWTWDITGGEATSTCVRMPYVVGDTLWVRESFQRVFEVAPGKYSCLLPTGSYPDHCYRWLYRATDDNNKPNEPQFPWRPSIHMPRIAARIFLRVTDVRVQRVQEISEADIRAEGIEQWLACSNNLPGATPVNDSRSDFRKLWDSINGKRPGCAWSDNPWVWCISFDRITDG